MQLKGVGERLLELMRWFHAVSEEKIRERGDQTSGERLVSTSRSIQCAWVRRGVSEDELHCIRTCNLKALDLYNSEASFISRSSCPAGTFTGLPLEGGGSTSPPPPVPPHSSSSSPSTEPDSDSKPEPSGSRPSTDMRSSESRACPIVSSIIRNTPDTYLFFFHGRVLITFAR
jgi:hypothetical protein